MRFLALWSASRHVRRHEQPPKSYCPGPRFWFGSLFCLEGEADGGWLPGSNGYILSLSSVSFVPCRQSVSPRRYVELEGTTVIAHTVGALHYHNVGLHPRMDVALDWYRDFFVGPNHIQ